MMTIDLYYSERNVGGKEHALSEALWGGFVSFVESRARDGWYSEKYPLHCFEAPLPIDTDQNALGQAFSAHNPRVPWPLDPQKVPRVLDALDVIEFFGRIISKPTKRSYHDYGRHHHIIEFDRDQGFEEYCKEINTMFRRCNYPYKLNALRKIERVGPPVLQEKLESALFCSQDDELNRLLNTARSKFKDPDINIRTESLEKLWDAWERLKTILPGDKKTSVKTLLDEAVSESTFRLEIENEAKTLTSIGNNFMIRHSETNKVPIKESEHIDYLFHRMFALIFMLLKSREMIKLN